MTGRKEDEWRRRTRINPERAQSEAMTEYARVLLSFAKGRSNFIETADWTIEPYAGIGGAANLLHHPAGREIGEYTFVLNTDNDRIAMENYHRRAHQGSGITAFSDMEHMAAALATIASKEVQMVFPLFGQARTGLFLLARGYHTTLLESLESHSPLPALQRNFSPVR